MRALLPHTLLPRARVRARSFSLSSAVDFRFVRDNVDLVERNARERNSPGDARLVARLYAEYGALQAGVDSLRGARRAIASSAGDAAGRVEEGRRLKGELAAAEARLENVRVSLEAAARELPTLSHPDAPVGPEKCAVEIMRGGVPRTTFLDDNESQVGTASRAGRAFKPRDHVELCRLLGIAEFERTADAISGAGFVTFVNEGVELELAITQWALARLRKEGFMLTMPPDLARASLVEACGFNPRRSVCASDAQGTLTEQVKISTFPHVSSQVYSVAGSPLCLVGTGEIPLAGLHASQLLPSRKDKSFPLLYAALTHCFRHEAGGGGAASRGLYRLHQFTKVEMFAYSAPHEPGSLADVDEARQYLADVREAALVSALCRQKVTVSSTMSPVPRHAASDALLCRLVDIQVSLVRELGLAFRVLDMPTEELGASAHRKVDIEAWMPCRGMAGGDAIAGGGSYGEITSASLCADFQARRLGVRFRGDGDVGTRFMHTLNATGAAVPRLVLAILETHQRADGSVKVPECLRPFMGGRDRILPKKPATVLYRP